MTQIYNEDYEETQPQEGDFPVFVASYSEANNCWDTRTPYGKGYDTGGNGDLWWFDESGEPSGNCDFANGYLWNIDRFELERDCLRIIEADVNFKP